MKASCHGVPRKQAGTRLLLAATGLSTGSTSATTITAPCHYRRQCRRHYASSSECSTGDSRNIASHRFTTTSTPAPLSASRSSSRPSQQCWAAGAGQTVHHGNGPGDQRRRFSCTNRVCKREQPDKAIRESLESADADLIPGDVASWKPLFALMEKEHGHDGVWACFNYVRERHQLHLMLLPASAGLRDAIIDAAVQSDSRLETLLQLAIRLLTFSREWPDLYAKVVHAFLRRDELERAVKWHLQLSRHFPPGPDVLGGLLSSFIFDPRPEMRQTLVSIYIFSSERSLYDRLVPFLFDSGNERTTRYWRRIMVQVGDLPTSPRAWHFINFMDRFGKLLAPEEEKIAKLYAGGAKITSSNNDDGYFTSASPKSTSFSSQRGIYHDDFVAKWLASSWLSVEFTINLMHKFGVAVVGTRSLQALALREPDARAVAAQIARLDALGIQISHHAYCRVLVFFARTGRDSLLQALLRTDIHPDEFDDPARRRIIMHNAIEARDTASQKLIDAVEAALESDDSPRRLNLLLHNTLRARPLGKAKLIVDRMEALNVTMSQQNAATLLNGAMLGVSKHPTRWKRPVQRGKDDPALDRAINVARRVASQGIAIPISYWDRLLYSLGRHGRFDELLQLCLEIVDIYHPPGGGLVPVYRNDMPPSRFEANNSKAAANAQQSDETWWHTGNSEDKGLDQVSGDKQDTHYIPGDLRLRHTHHPMAALFSTPFQRNIVRWGFDQSLAGAPSRSSCAAASASSPSTMRLAEHDVACGVRILALLRDRGVPISKPAICNTLYRRMILGEIPGRRHRSRDAQYVEPENIKTLVERAWATDGSPDKTGQELLPSLPGIHKELEKVRPRVWKRYPILFKSNYGGGVTDGKEAATAVGHNNGPRRSSLAPTKGNVILSDDTGI